MIWVEFGSKATNSTAQSDGQSWMFIGTLWKYHEVEAVEEIGTFLHVPELLYKAQLAYPIIPSSQRKRRHVLFE